MGQYHQVFNIDKKEYINPHKIGLGLKMGEQIGGFYATMGDIMYLLLAISHGRGGGDVPTDGIEHLLGRWAGDRVLVVGDYSEPEDVDIPLLVDPHKQIYKQAYGAPEEGETDEYYDPEWVDISDDICLMIKKLWGIEIDASSGWRQRNVVDYKSYLGPWKSKDDDDTGTFRPDMVIGA